MVSSVLVSLTILVVLTSFGTCSPVFWDSDHGLHESVISPNADVQGGYSHDGTVGRIISPAITTKIDVQSQSFPLKVPVKVPIVKYIPEIVEIPTVKTIKVPVPVVKTVPVKVEKTVKVPVPVASKSVHGLTHYKGTNEINIHGGDFIHRGLHGGDIALENIHGGDLVHGDIHGADIGHGDFHGADILHGDFHAAERFLHGAEAFGHSDFHGLGGDLDIVHAGDGFLGKLGH